MKVLGISAFYHDSAAAIVDGADILAAAQEERFTRKKHDASFPANAVGYCLRETGLTLEELDAVVFFEKPFLKFERLLETYLAFAPKGFSSFRQALPLWINEKIFQKRLLLKEMSQFGDTDISKKMLFTEHHASHAASCYLPSPFTDSAILTLDGVGEWTTTVLSHGQGKVITPLNEIRFPSSLGLLYSALTYYLGFRVNSGEYKVMGLAPYGEPIYVDKFKDIIDVKEDGSFRLDQKYFEYCHGLKMVNSKFEAHFGQPVRTPETKIEKFHVDIAASLQVVTEDIILKIGRHAAKVTGSKNLCLAGGVALNCVANGKLQREGIFENIYIQPAAGDAGGALGAALIASHQNPAVKKHEGPGDNMKGAYLGTAYSADEVRAQLDELGAVYTELSNGDLIEQAALALSEGQAMGWMNGRMEFGPRALGARSILGDPRSKTMQRDLNLKVKFRESFRPFAPSVLAEDVSEYFDMDIPSPYMLMVSQVSDKILTETGKSPRAYHGLDEVNEIRSTIPSITHVDNSARIQTVHNETNPKFHKLLTSFKKKTGVGVLINTSFNIRGEPIVEAPKDAYRCFMGTDLDILVVENFILRKSEQPAGAKIDYTQQFELD